MVTVFLGDTFSLDDAQFLGRPIASRTLVQSIFLSDRVDRVLAIGSADMFTGLNLAAEVEQKLQMVQSLDQLAGYFSRGEVTAVLCSNFGKKFAGLVSFRNLTGAACPVYGFTHTLSYQDEVGALYRLVCAGIRPDDGILCTSNAAIKVMSRLLERVYETLSFKPDGPALIHFPLGHAEADQSAPVEKCTTHFQVAYVGRLNWRSKADVLVIPRILGCLPVGHNIRFVIAGAADNADYVRLLSQYCQHPEISIAMDITDSEKTRLYQESQVMFSPSDNYQETFGLTVLEAMHHGCVPVVSDFDGYRDTVSDGRDGILLRTYAARVTDLLWKAQVLMPDNIYHGWWAAGVSIDPARAADELYHLSRDPARWRAMSEQGRVTAREYDVLATARRFSALLDTAIEAGSRYQPAAPGSGTRVNPYHIDYSDVFSCYPSEHWSDQQIVLTGAGQRYLAGPAAHYVPQLGLLSPAVVLADVTGLLEAVDAEPSVSELLARRIEPIVFSLALKNGLISVSR